MKARLAAAALLAALAGCETTTRSQLVPPGTPAASVQSSYLWSREPAEKTASLRALYVAQKIYDANPSLGIKPKVFTAGLPVVEIFHQGGGGPDGCTVYLTQGLIDACKTDDQLAAVLCVELGRIAAERASHAGDDDPLPPIDERVGNDGGSFGPPDGTRMMEAARREKHAREQKLNPDPTKCAAEYLRKAGYPAQSLLEVSALLNRADESETVREAVGAVTLSRPVSRPAGGSPAGGR